MKQFLREYKIEVVAALLALLGIFLLVERMQIRVTLFRIVRSAWRTVSGAMGSVINVLVYRVLHTTTSDLIGLVLIVLAIVMVLWRVRVRLAKRLAGRTCPLCGGELRRSHRRWQDHLLSLLVPVVRFRCRNRECRWEGVRARIG
jgi:hypothetical protein